MPSTCAIIVAGGSGERFGDPRGKQFVPLAGRALLSWSLAAFDAAPSVGAIVLVVPTHRAAEVRRSIVEPSKCSTPVSLAPAGESRQGSVRAGLRAVPGSCEFVAVHDGARPLVRVHTIEEAISAIIRSPQLGGVVCASRVTDTLKESADGATVSGTADRSRLWGAMTPQVFRTAELTAWHERARAEGFEGTDDASLAERYGATVGLVETPRDNLKVTLPEDLAIAEALLSLR